MRELQNYSWPGNMRELRNMLERAFMLAQGEALTVHHFPGLTTESPVKLTNSISLKLNDMEDAHILQVVKELHGDMHKASEALGLCLSSLYRRLGKIKAPPASQA